MSSTRYPNWAIPMMIYGGLLFAAVLADSVISVWGESRPVGAFAEQLVASIIYWGMILSLTFVPIFVGFSVAKRFDRALFGWIAGVGTFAAIGIVGMTVASQIPGVGWRFDRMMNSDTGIEY